jgi:hypothetical protein
MPQDRSRLHLSKVGAFADWAEGNGFTREPTKGEYEVLRLRPDGGGAPLIWFRRDRGDHATTQYQRRGEGSPVRLVNRWLRGRNGPA